MCLMNIHLCLDLLILNGLGSARFEYCHAPLCRRHAGRLKKKKKEERRRGSRSAAAVIRNRPALFPSFSLCPASSLYRRSTIFLRDPKSIGWPGKYGTRPDASRRDKSSRSLKNEPALQSAVYARPKPRYLAFREIYGAGYQNNWIPKRICCP